VINQAAAATSSKTEVSNSKTGSRALRCRHFLAKFEPTKGCVDLDVEDAVWNPEHLVVGDVATDAGAGCGAGDEFNCC